MKSKKISEMTLDELEKQVKTAKAGAIVMGFSVGLMAIISIFSWVTARDGFGGSMTAITIMPLFFTPLLIINIKRYRDIKNEIQNRNKET